MTLASPKQWGSECPILTQLSPFTKKYQARSNALHLSAIGTQMSAKSFILKQMHGSFHESTIGKGFFEWDKTPATGC
jgi:hypothetical protein